MAVLVCSKSILHVNLVVHLILFNVNLLNGHIKNIYIKKI